MNKNVPSDSELDALALQVDDQLNKLLSQSSSEPKARKGALGERAPLPTAPEQQALIEQSMGEPFETFWQKYKRHARRDLCLPGGQLHEQWLKWCDLRSKDAVKMSLAALAGMGISTANLPAVAVAATVCLLNVIIKIGIEAVCEDCTGE